MFDKSKWEPGVGDSVEYCDPRCQSKLGVIEKLLPKQKVMVRWADGKVEPTFRSMIAYAPTEHQIYNEICPVVRAQRATQLENTVEETSNYDGWYWD